METYLAIFKTMSDKTRLRILWILLKAKTELCVCEIMDSLQENQYNVSRHIKILKNAGLVREKKTGRWVFYSVVKPDNQSLKSIFRTIISLPRTYFRMDNKRLQARLSMRHNGECVTGMYSTEWKKKMSELKSTKEK